MKTNRISRKVLPLGLAGAIAVALAAGTALTGSADAKTSPDRTAAEAQKALAKGDAAKAVQLAEAIVAANPREASYRALLGQAYLRAGRFDSAVAALNDAMKLGDNSARTALGLSLAYVGAGRSQDSVAILNDWRDAIPASDLGLALALSGETSRGVAILSDALRAGDASPKLRQNLAYAYALDGRWREARVMAAQDIPADQLDARISDWAVKAKPEDSKLRVASLLGTQLRADPGMPTALALNDSAQQEQLAAETGVGKSAAPAVAAAELPASSGESATALAQYQPVSAPVPAAAGKDSFTGAPLAVAAPAPEVQAPAPVQMAASHPVVQPLPAAAPAARPVRVAVAAPAVAHRPGLRPRHGIVAVAGKGSSHAVQLGSFSSELGARRAWGYYAARNPELRNFHMTITPAVVRGKNFWRVAAAGLDGNGAGGLCSKVKSRGGVCFAYAVGRVQPGRAASAPAMAHVAAKPKAPVMAAAKGVAGPSNARRK